MGIGKAVADECLRRGMKVVLADVNRMPILRAPRPLPFVIWMSHKKSLALMGSLGAAALDRLLDDSRDDSWWQTAFALWDFRCGTVGDVRDDRS